MAAIALIAALPAAALAARPPEDAPPPGRAENLSQVLAQTAAVVEGEVVDVTNTYTVEEGPWLVATVANLVVHSGAVQPGTIRLRFRGGPLPDGTFLAPETMPRLYKGKRTIFFLRNTFWTETPLVANGLMRVEAVNGREILVGQDENPLQLFADDGLVFGGGAVFEDSVDSDMAPKARPAGAAAAAKALDRAGFLRTLRGHVTRRGSPLGGRFYDEPRKLDWRALPAVPAPNDMGARSSSTKVEADTPPSSHPNARRK
jgi:hypothetical protein